MKRFSAKKPSLYLAAIKLFFKGLAACLLAFLEQRVPVGYEDDTGFHISA